MSEEIPDEIPEEMREALHEEINAKYLINYILIFTNENSDKFFQSRLMKQTRYTKEDLDNLTHNYIHHGLWRLKEKV